MTECYRIGLHRYNKSNAIINNTLWLVFSDKTSFTMSKVGGSVFDSMLPVSSVSYKGSIRKTLTYLGHNKRMVQVAQ